MADQELRQRRIGNETQDTRKKNREARVYKIAKDPEPCNWWLVVFVVFIVIMVLLFLYEAIVGFRHIKAMFK